jgi:hypothetical protein
MPEPPVAPEVLPLALGLLGLDGIVLPDWASAVPLNSNTAAAVASRPPLKSSFVNCIGRLPFVALVRGQDFRERPVTGV